MSDSALSAECQRLLDFLATLLAPLFLCATGGDHGSAQAFARDTIAGFHPGAVSELLLAAQSVGLSLGAIAAIGRSASPGLPDKEATRLRGQADRLSRSASRCTKAIHRPATQAKLAIPKAAGPSPTSPQPAAEAKPASSQSSSPQAASPQAASPQPTRPQPATTQPTRLQPAPPTTSRADWAAAMRDVAAEFAAQPGPANANRAALLRGAAHMAMQPSHTAPPTSAPVRQ